MYHPLGDISLNLRHELMTYFGAICHRLMTHFGVIFCHRLMTYPPEICHEMMTHQSQT